MSEAPRPALNEAAARGLDRLTRAVTAATFEAVRLTFESESWRHLGFGSFEAWMADQPRFQLTRDERRAIAAEYREIGMTQRQIAAAVGVHESTISRDVSEPLADASQPEPIAASSAAKPLANASQLDPIDLHEATRGIDPGEKGFVALFRGVIRELEEAELHNAGAVTPGKVGVMRDLFAEVDQLHDEWMPYLGRTLQEVK